MIGMKLEFGLFSMKLSLSSFRHEIDQNWIAAVPIMLLNKQITYIDNRFS